MTVAVRFIGFSLAVAIAGCGDEAATSGQEALDVADGGDTDSADGVAPDTRSFDVSPDTVEPDDTDSPEDVARSDEVVEPTDVADEPDSAEEQDVAAPTDVADTTEPADVPEPSDVPDPVDAEGDVEGDIDDSNLTVADVPFEDADAAEGDVTDSDLVSPPIEAACNDGVDDDDDGATDCADPECAAVAPCTAASACCDPGGGPGCPAEPAVAACVCEADPLCCTGTWDAFCASRAATCGGRCVDAIDCCQPHSESGCADSALEQCVCAAEPECCEGSWSLGCVFAAAACGADCPGLVVPEDCDNGVDDDDDGATDCVDAGCKSAPSCAGPAASCCVSGSTPGCPEPAIAACVCEGDASCCEDDWDLACAAAALGCGATCDPAAEDCMGGVDEDLDTKVDCEDSDCAGVFPCSLATPPCCDDTATPGCAIGPVEACVCAQEPACCSDAWTSTCVGIAQEVCDMPCPTETTPAPCCDATPGQPGCAASALIDACVCAVDATCCVSGWDDACVALGVAVGCMTCQ